ncbi:MAG: O-antigen ligase family protein [Proteobacteria bacterium]|nr:O-antigen ligase family protein [Pseudomonadota bacterium]
MRQNFKRLADFRGDPMNWLAALAFFTPAFFLTLKGTATTSLFLMFFICSWSIIKAPRHYLTTRGSQFWVLILCLLSPFLAEVIAQAGRGSFIGSSLDGPSRVILAAGVFVYLSKKDCTNLLPALSIGSAVGIVLVFLYLQVFPEYYWSDRAATYFVDPITLPCYTVVLLGLYLFGYSSKIPKKISNFVTLLISILTIYIVIESQSRSAWVAGIVLGEIYLLYLFRASLMKQILVSLALALGVFAMFTFSDVVGGRSSEAYRGLVSFLEVGGGQQSSTGQRMVLLLIDFELIKDNLFFGVADGTIPAFDYLKALIPSINEEIYGIKAFAGSHSEVSAQLVRKGLFLGGFALWGLFLYPLYLVSCKLRAWSTADPGLSAGIYGLIVPVFFSGITIQVFNLKMTMSFYMLCLAILLAYCLPRIEASEHGLKN